MPNDTATHAILDHTILMIILISGMYVTYGRIAEIVTGNWRVSAFLVTYGCYRKKQGWKTNIPGFSNLTMIHPVKINKIAINIYKCVHACTSAYAPWTQWSSVKNTRYRFYWTYYTYGVMPTYHTNQLIPTAAMGITDSSIRMLRY